MSFDLDPELERTWNAADVKVTAPPGFEQRLFARLEREAPLRAAVPMREAMPWWVRAAGERHVALAFLVAGLVLASPAWWLRTTVPVVAALRSAEVFLAPWLTPLGRALAQPRVELALALALAPLLAWGAYLLARAIERGTMRLTLRLRA